MNEQSSVRIFGAPLQGVTEAPFRSIHRKTIGYIDQYFTPFIRIDKGTPRQRDLRDSQLTDNDCDILTPQIIFRDIHEFKIICDVLYANGHRKIDLNMGCPFPPQTNKGRGAAVLHNIPLLADIAYITNHLTDISFSIKIRLGVDTPTWQKALPVINDMRLTHLTVHPRLAAQQYKGTVDINAYNAISHQTHHKLIYNGDITTLYDVQKILSEIDTPHGIMIGRGLISRPTISREIVTGEEESPTLIRSTIIQIFHNLLDHYTAVLSGQAHVLMKMSTYLPYFELYLGHKTIKRLNKARSTEEIRSILNTI